MFPGRPICHDDDGDEGEKRGGGEEVHRQRLQCMKKGGIYSKDGKKKKKKREKKMNKTRINLGRMMAMMMMIKMVVINEKFCEVCFCVRRKI